MPGKKTASSKTPWILILIGVLVLLVALSFLVLILKKSNPDMPQPKSPALNLSGTYKGNLPCADCPGIEETLTLNASDSAHTVGSYLISDLYKEKSTQPFNTVGSWEKVSENILKLTPEDPSAQPSYYQVMPGGKLEMLNSNMQKIDSPFDSTLVKQ